MVTLEEIATTAADAEAELAPFEAAEPELAELGEAEEAGSAESEEVSNLKDGWDQRTADSGRGQVWQRPGATGNADSMRVMESTEKYPDGYVRFYNEHGQPVDLEGKPGPNSQTHISLRPDGSYPLPEGW